MNRPALIVTVLTCLAVTSSPVPGQSRSEPATSVRPQRSRDTVSSWSRGRTLGVLLDAEVTVQFQETPAREAISFMGTAAGLKIIGRFDDDRVGHGIDPDTPITLDVVSAPAVTVLEMILDQCSGQRIEEACTWQLRNGFVEVGTRERLNAARDTRHYPVRDLLFVHPRFDNAPALDIDAALSQGGGAGGFGGGGPGGGGGGNSGGGGGGDGGGNIIGPPGEEAPRPGDRDLATEIIRLIVSSVEPEAWRLNGGDTASIRYHHGALIVLAPDYIHRQLNGYPVPIRP